MPCGFPKREAAGPWLGWRGRGRLSSSGSRGERSPAFHPRQQPLSGGGVSGTEHREALAQDLLPGAGAGGAGRRMRRAPLPGPVEPRGESGLHALKASPGRMRGPSRARGSGDRGAGPAPALQRRSGGGRSRQTPEAVYLTAACAPGSLRPLRAINNASPPPPPAEFPRPPKACEWATRPPRRCTVQRAARTLSCFKTQNPNGQGFKFPKLYLLPKDGAALACGRVAPPRPSPWSFVPSVYHPVMGVSCVCFLVDYKYLLHTLA